MRCRAIPLIGLLALAACETEQGAAGDITLPPETVTAVECADAADLEQRALADQRAVGQTRGDQDRILLVSRASFFASLAVIADLRCRIGPAEIDDALTPALDAATRASNTGGFYEAARSWIEANMLATQVIGRLVQQLAGTGSPD